MSYNKEIFVSSKNSNSLKFHTIECYLFSFPQICPAHRPTSFWNNNIKRDVHEDHRELVHPPTTSLRARQGFDTEMPPSGSRVPTQTSRDSGRRVLHLRLPPPLPVPRLLLLRAKIPLTLQIHWALHWGVRGRRWRGDWQIGQTL